MILKVLKNILICASFFLGSAGQVYADGNSLSVNDGIIAYEQNDFATALRVWRFHADQGDSTAQTYLGALYYLGKGVEQSYNQAVYWHKKSAAQGDVYGLLNLAECYEKGLGVKQNLHEALRLYNLSAAKNLQLAVEGAARVKRQIGLSPPPQASSSNPPDADKLFNNCVNSGAGVPTQLGYSACFDAFNALIKKAQTGNLSVGQKRLSWASAGQAAGIAALQKLKIDNAKTLDAALTEDVCNIAINGMKAYSQVVPPGKPDELDGVFMPSASLSNISQKCVAKASGSAGNTIQIYVKTLTGKTVPIEIPQSATVKFLKERVYDEEGIPPEQQRMIFAGEQLEDEQTLKAYNIGADSTLHVILRTRP